MWFDTEMSERCPQCFVLFRVEEAFAKSTVAVHILIPGRQHTVCYRIPPKDIGNSFS